MVYNTNIIKHEHKIIKSMREEISGHKGTAIWFTGLSGSGKSTIAGELEYFLWKRNCRTYLLDGDNIRLGLNKDLGFSDEDRSENIRRISEVASLFVDSGTIIIIAFISPFKKDRMNAREIIGSKNFLEVYIKCPLSVCEKRDPKSLYKKARKGLIDNFTGIDSDYEEPENPDILIKSDKMKVPESINMIFSKLNEYNIIKI